MKKKILVIDDDALVLKSVRNLLTNEGYEVECAKNSEEAELMIRRFPFNLIVCDIRMPGKDGISAMKDLKHLCQTEFKLDIPFILITGYASEEAPIDAIKLGAKDYLLKPFDLNELSESVRKHIA